MTAWSAVTLSAEVLQCRLTGAHGSFAVLHDSMYVCCRNILPVTPKQYWPCLQTAKDEAHWPDQVQIVIVQLPAVEQIVSGPVCGSPCSSAEICADCHPHLDSDSTAGESSSENKGLMGVPFAHINYLPKSDSSISLPLLL